MRTCFPSFFSSPKPSLSLLTTFLDSANQEGKLYGICLEIITKQSGSSSIAPAGTFS